MRKIEVDFNELTEYYDFYFLDGVISTIINVSLEDAIKMAHEIIALKVKSDQDNKA